MTVKVRDVWKASVILTALLVIGCSGSGQPEGVKAQQAPPAAPKAGAPEQSEFAAGYALFNKSCRVCHGNEGNGRGSRKGPSLQRSEYSYGRTREAVLESIRNGRPGGMPAYGKVFTNEQIEALATYVLTLK